MFSCSGIEEFELLRIALYVETNEHTPGHFTFLISDRELDSMVGQLRSRRHKYPGACLMPMRISFPPVDLNYGARGVA